MQIQLVTYLKFLLKSTNQHGVHSPFVFNYLTKCLYKEPRKSKEKTLDILIKSLIYFGFNNIKIIGNPSFKKELQEQFVNLDFNSQKIDMLLVEASHHIEFETIFSKYELHNDSLIVFNNIYRSESEHAYWNTIIKSEKVTVSIDMYYCGVIFIRKEQRKEHFTIRI
ncbi:hypothetical protein [uncultured Croceitalea sp.]|uniref:hypothetical protein n=1 Tax=uncultured Croceitalea sp. TaxID=1798908 RepID=UPI00374E7209